MIKKIEEKELCTICNKTYKNKNSLHAHIANVHKNNLNQCEYCSKQFTSLYSLKRHKQSCTIYLEQQEKNDSKVDSIVKSKEKDLLIESLKKDLDLSQQQYKESAQRCKELERRLFTTNDQLIHSKDNFNDHIVKTLQQQSIQQQISSNNNNGNIQVNVTTVTDKELCRVLQPIKSDNVKRTISNNLDHYISTNMIEPKYIMDQNLFITNIIESKDIQEGVCITDRSRNSYSWMNADGNNQLVKDQYGKMLFYKTLSIPSSVPEIKDKLDTVIKLNCKIATQANVEDKDEFIKTNENVKKANQFLRLVKTNKVPEKEIKKIGQTSIDAFKDKTTILSLVDSDIKSYHLLQKQTQEEEKKQEWLGVITFLVEEIKKQINSFLQFEHFEQIAYLVSCIITTHNAEIKRIGILNKNNKNNPWIQIHKDKIEDKTIFIITIRKSKDSIEQATISKTDLLLIIKKAFYICFPPILYKNETCEMSETSDNLTFWSLLKDIHETDQSDYIIKVQSIERIYNWLYGQYNQELDEYFILQLLSYE